MSSRFPNGKPHIEKQEGEFRSAFQESAPYLTLGFQLAAVVLLFFFIGYWIDNKFGISPAGKLAGIVLGCIGGFFRFFRSASSLAANDKKKQMSKKNEN
jgi:F0F1-type ATP synthase assembly protein I